MKVLNIIALLLVVLMLAVHTEARKVGFSHKLVVKGPGWVDDGKPDCWKTSSGYTICR